MDINTRPRNNELTSAHEYVSMFESNLDPFEYSCIMKYVSFVYSLIELQLKCGCPQETIGFRKIYIIFRVLVSQGSVYKSHRTRAGI